MAETSASHDPKVWRWLDGVAVTTIIVLSFWPILVVLGFDLWAPVAIIHETFGVHYVPYPMMEQTYYFVRNAHLFTLMYAYLPSAIVHDVLTNASDITRFQIYSLTVYAIHGVVLLGLAGWTLRSGLRRTEKALVLLVAFAQPFLTTRMVNALTINYQMLEAVLFATVAAAMIQWFAEPVRFNARRVGILGALAAVAVGTKLSLVAVIVPFLVVLAVSGTHPGRERRRAIGIFVAALSAMLLLGFLVYFRFRPDRLVPFMHDIIVLNLDRRWLDQRVELVVLALKRWLSINGAAFGFTVVVTWAAVLFIGAVVLWWRRRPPRLGLFVAVSCGVAAFLVYELSRRIAPHSVIDLTLFCLLEIAVLVSVYSVQSNRIHVAVASVILIVGASLIEIGPGYQPIRQLHELRRLSQTVRALHGVLDSEPSLPVVYYMLHTNASVLFPSVDLYPLVSGDRAPLEHVYLHYRHPRVHIRSPAEGLWPGPHLLVVPEYLPRGSVDPPVEIFALLPPFEMVLGDPENACHSFDVSGRRKLDIQFTATATRVVVCTVRRLPSVVAGARSGDRTGLVDLAVARAARQSSTFADRSADRAVDGTARETEESQYAQTLHERYPWWQVDLGGVHDVREVRLWHRDACCQPPLRSFWIFVGSEPFTSSDPVMTRHQPGVSSVFVPGEAAQPVVIPVNVRARRVRIQLTEYSALSLEKVEVWGRPSPVATSVAVKP